MASRIFRSTVCEWLRNALRASCWLMVLAPCRMSPAATLEKSARATPARSTPQCWKKRRSSVASTACRTTSGIWASGSGIRFSMKNSPANSPFRS